jgi:RNA polymerase sigma factor for flagellar operon FliA
MNAYARGGRSADPSARDRLITEHAEMARRIALRIGRRVPNWISSDDLVAAALLGLAEAADRFDPRRGESFVAYAEQRIRGAVQDELRRGDIMPRRVRAQARKVGRTARELEQRLGRPPEDEEMAAALDVPVEEFREELESLTHVTVVELDHTALSRAESREHGPAAVAEHRQLVGRVVGGLGRLPERDRLVLSLYYVEELSYGEIGRVLGVTESRVCQLHGRAVARLRAELTDFTGDEEDARE